MSAATQTPWTYTTYLYYLIHYYSPVNRERRKKHSDNRKPEDNMKLLLILVLITVLSSSCVTRKACERRYPPVTFDSTRIETNTVTIYRDTTLYLHVPGDTVLKSIAMDEGVSILRTPFSASYAWVTEGILKHKLEQKDTSIVQNLRGALRTTIKDQQQNKTIEKVKYVNKLTNWQVFQIYLGRVLAFLIITYLLLLVLKKAFL